MPRSRLLGNGAPTRAFGGGTAIVATRLPGGLCLRVLPGHEHGTVRCRLDKGHADVWHKGGGWRWHDDGRAERLPRVGG